MLSINKNSKPQTDGGHKIKKQVVTTRKSFGGGNIGQLLAVRESQSRDTL